jgi:hypothetical protein
VSAGENSDFFVFHSQRNRLWVLAKNVPSPLLWLVAALQIVVVPLTVLRRDMGKWRTALKRLPPACVVFRRLGGEDARCKASDWCRPGMSRACSFGIRARRFVTLPNS